MSDVHDPATRSYNMSQIKGKNTKPEILVRKLLHQNGFRYSLHSKKLPGKPDIVLTKYRTVIFVNGCFWHGHDGCKYFKLPNSRKEWWSKKIKKTKERDSIKQNKLKDTGWTVLVIWECSLKKDKKERTLYNLVASLRNRAPL